MSVPSQSRAEHLAAAQSEPSDHVHATSTGSSTREHKAVHVRVCFTLKLPAALCIFFLVRLTSYKIQKRAHATSSTVRCRQRRTRTQHTVARTRHIQRNRYTTTHTYITVHGMPNDEGKTIKRNAPRKVAWLQGDRGKALPLGPYFMPVSCVAASAHGLPPPRAHRPATPRPRPAVRREGRRRSWQAPPSSCRGRFTAGHRLGSACGAPEESFCDGACS